MQADSTAKTLRILDTLFIMIFLRILFKIILFLFFDYVIRNTSTRRVSEGDGTFEETQGLVFGI